MKNMMMKKCRTVFLCLFVAAIFLPSTIIGTDPTGRPYQQSVNPQIVPSVVQIGQRMTQQPVPSVSQLGQAMSQLSVRPMTSPMGMMGQVGQVQPTYLNYSGTPMNYGQGFNQMQAFTAPPGVDLGTEVELSIRVANLPEPEIMNFEAVCVTYVRPSNGTDLIEVHRTEGARNELHPEYKEKPTLSYSFGETQTIVFKIINTASAAKSAAKAPKTAKETTGAAVGGAKAPKAPTQEKEDVMGYAELVLADLIARNIVTVPLQKKNAMGQISNTTGELTVRAEKLVGNNNEVRMELSGVQLFRGGMMNNPSDPCVEIYKRGELADKFELVYKSEILMGKTSVSWKPITVTVRHLCNGDYRRMLKFIIWDWNTRAAKREVIGEFQITLEQLTQSMGRTFTLTKPPEQFQTPMQIPPQMPTQMPMQMPPQMPPQMPMQMPPQMPMQMPPQMPSQMPPQMPMQIPSQMSTQMPTQMSMQMPSYAQITIAKIEIIPVPSLAEFLQGGLQIHCSIAIDFTKSNGDPRSASSFHFRDPQGNLNQYEEAIKAVVSAIEPYDHDKKFQAYGFGGRYPGGPLLVDFNINPSGLDCWMTQGVLSSYRECLKAIELSEPCYFAPTIRKVIEVAERTDHRDNYYILLILTHGDIADIDETEKVVAYAAGLPISIIIVGIGDETTVFTQMDRLDADHLSQVKLLTDPIDATGAAPTEKTPARRRDIVQFIPFHKFRAAARNALPNQPNAGSFLAKQVLAEVPHQLISFMRSKGYTPKAPNFNNGLVLGQYYGSMPEQPFGVPPPAFATYSPFPLPGGLSPQAQYNTGAMPQAQFNSTGIPTPSGMMPQTQYNPNIPQSQYILSGVSQQHYAPSSVSSQLQYNASIAQPGNYQNTSPAYGSYGTAQTPGSYGTAQPPVYPSSAAGNFPTYPPPPSTQIPLPQQQFQGGNAAFPNVYPPPPGSANLSQYVTPNPQYSSQNNMFNTSHYQ